MNCSRCLRSILEGQRYYQLALAEHTPAAGAVPLYDLGALCSKCVDDRTVVMVRLDDLKTPLGKVSEEPPKRKRKKQPNK